jgi:hypothetical protein
MSSRQKVSPIAKARVSKAVAQEQPPVASSSSPPAKKESPLARAREGAKKGERRASADKGPATKVSPIARARASKSPQLVHKDLEVAGDDDDYEFPPLSVPFGLECYLTKPEIEAATEFVKNNKSLKFQIYTVDYDEDSKDKKKEYETVLVFGWFRPAVGVDINDIWRSWEEKKQKWYEFLWAAKLMPQGKILDEIRYPEMLDPVEEEPEESE